MASSPDTELDPAAEAEVRALFHSKYGSYGRTRVEAYLDGLLDIEHHVGPLREFLDVAGPLDPTLDSRLLISGFGAGSEIVAARRLGFGNVHGTEVDPFLRDVARARLRSLAGIHLEVYDGGTLPFPDGYFTHLTSSHIIEHTPAPFVYLSECFRVLAPGGFMSLEFPSRYHWKELHTGVPSFEWLPRPLRNGVLRLLSSRAAPVPASKGSLYREILETNLQQVSLATVRRGIRRAVFPTTLLDVKRPASGVLRCVIRRESPASAR